MVNIKYFLYAIFYLIMRLFKINNKKIVIVSYFGKGFGDSGKYICNQLFGKKGIRVIWLINKEYNIDLNEFPKEVEVVNYNSLKGHYHLATSKIWIDNCRKPFFVKKRREQFYIQLWHGAPPLKKIEADAENKLSYNYLKNAKSDSEKIDLFISNSKLFTNMIHRTFWYNGKIEEIGIPRNDILLQGNNLEINKKINKYFDFSSKEVCTLLYAPTFRNTGNLDVYDVDFNELIKILEEKTSKEWRILLRLHPNLSSKSTNMLFTDKILNASLYPDVQELFLYSDILLTDYSSVMFDFALTKKPVFLYCKDSKEYAEERGMYFELEKLPFPVAYSNDELNEKIKGFNKELYSKELNVFFKDIGMYTRGDSSERLKEIIFNVLK